MNYRNGIVKAFSLIVLSVCLTQNANAMMSKWLLALAGDACLVASYTSLSVKNLSKEELIAYRRRQVSPSMYNQICKDIDSISPYIPWMIPVGLIVASGSRFGMIAKNSSVLGEIGGITCALVSIPVNLALIGSAYSIRLDSAKENAGVVDRAKDLVWEQQQKPKKP